MLGWNNNSNTQTVDPSKIIKTLREMVKKVVMDFRLLSSSSNVNEEDDGVIEAVPISFKPPQHTNFDRMMSPKKRVTTLLVGETLVSFQLPCDCPFGPEDLDMLAKEGRSEVLTQNINEEIIDNVPRYSFLQRLNGWKLERRQRVNGRFDMYYHHLQSMRVFRSITEIVNFLMYEVYPNKPVQKSSVKSKVGENDHSGRITPLKRKFEELKSNDLKVEIQKVYDHHVPMFDLNDDHQTPIYDLDDHNKCQVSREEIIIDKFLAEAYDNLMNSFHRDQKSKSFDFDINEEICVEEDPYVERFLNEAYNNLMNSQNNESNPRKVNEKEKDKGKGKKITNAKESMEVQKTSNEKHKHFNIQENNGNVTFTDVDYEPSYVATTSREGRESSSTMEVAKSIACLHMDECDLINHI